MYKMNYHAFLDKVTIYTTVLVPSFRYFRSGQESRTIAAYLDAISVPVPALPVSGERELTVDSPVGPLDPVFRVGQWVGDAAPTIIYHHGTNENPYDRSFGGIFPHREQEIPANLIVVRAPFNSGLRAFARSIAELANYAAMLAASVQLVEGMVRRCRAAGSERVVVSGISLGGFVANLHHTYYNTATAYAPLLAGPVIEDVFLNSIYSKLVSVPDAAARAGIHNALSFADDFAHVAHDNLFPLLGRHDQYIRHAVQAPAYGEAPVATLEKSHVTGALAYAAMRRHVLGALEARPRATQTGDAGLVT